MPLARQTRMRRRIMGLAAAGVVVLAVWMYTAFQRSVRESNERNAPAVLKAIASAEADFRGNDRDGNRVQDFWTGDVASLYYLPDPDTGKPIGLIPRSLADADADPFRPGAEPAVPFHGYYIVAMEDDVSAGTTTPELYAQDTHGAGSLGDAYHSAKFGFCAYPADYPRSGRWTFMINEGNTVFRVETGGKPILRWPADDVPWHRKFGGA